MTRKALQVSSAFCLLAALLIPQAKAFRAEPEKPAQASPQQAAQEYQALLERVKKSDTTVDFGKMRLLQTQLDTYQPYGVDSDHPYAAFAKGDVARAKRLAEGILAQNYLDLESHATAAAVAEKAGDTAAAAHHHYVLDGVMGSILASGDGKSLETAYRVIAISEEYAVMGHFGLRVTGQALLNDEAGHAYDQLKGTDSDGKIEREIYFNIDPIFGSLDKELSE